MADDLKAPTAEEMERAPKLAARIVEMHAAWEAALPGERRKAKSDYLTFVRLIGLDVARCFLALHARVAELEKSTRAAQRLRVEWEASCRAAEARATTAEATLARYREALAQLPAEIITALDGMEETLDDQIYPVRLTENFDAPDDAEYHVVLTAKQYRGFERAMLKLHELQRAALLPSPAAATE